MKHLYILLLVILFVSCEEYYEPDIDKQEPAYVFDALITDQHEPYCIRITKSHGYNNGTELVENATVGVNCDDGNYYPFQYSYNGCYYSNPGEFVGEVGKSYQLKVTTSDSALFLSDWEELLPCPDIDYISAKEYQTKKITSNGSEYFEEVESGIMVMNSTNTNGFTPYYRYKCDIVVQTMQYYPLSIPVEILIYRPLNARSMLRIVDANKYSGGIITDNQLYQTPYLTFQYQDESLMPGVEFRLRYCGEFVLVKQYSLSENQYVYWSAINDLQSKTNYLFGQLENEPVGNISSLSDAKALGYFCVSAVKQKYMAYSLVVQKGWHNSVTKSIREYVPDCFPDIEGIEIYDSIKPDYFIRFEN